MKPVTRREILDFQTYDDARAAFRQEVMAAKALRRVGIGSCLTLLFENRLTVRYQVQEMIRAERMVRERDIRHEIETYNELLGGPGELGATLLIEIEDPAERDEKLGRWLALPRHVYLRLEDGRKVRAKFDRRQVGKESLSAVQYLKFDVGAEVPVTAGVDLPGIEAETGLANAQRAALREDLEGEGAAARRGDAPRRAQGTAATRRRGERERTERPGRRKR
ncbi:MAG: DUF3501 family protein [Planctomycetales bacterium]|nr:DUF3501 family protein [Planctomycetales bacterium]